MAIPKFQRIVEELPLTEAEAEFIEDAHTFNPEEMTAARVLADVYLSYKLRAIADDVIESNVRTSEARNKQAKALNLFTFALVLAVVSQTVVLYLN